MDGKKSFFVVMTIIVVFIPYVLAGRPINFQLTHDIILNKVINSQCGSPCSVFGAPCDGGCTCRPAFIGYLCLDWQKQITIQIMSITFIFRWFSSKPRRIRFEVVFLRCVWILFLGCDFYGQLMNYYYLVL